MSDKFYTVKIREDQYVALQEIAAVDRVTIRGSVAIALDLYISARKKIRKITEKVFKNEFGI